MDWCILSTNIFISINYVRHWVGYRDIRGTCPLPTRNSESRGRDQWTNQNHDHLGVPGYRNIVEKALNSACSVWEDFREGTVIVEQRPAAPGKQHCRQEGAQVQRPRGGKKHGACVHACVCVHVRACVCVCMCVRDTVSTWMRTGKTRKRRQDGKRTPAVTPSPDRFSLGIPDSPSSGKVGWGKEVILSFVPHLPLILTFHLFPSSSALSTLSFIQPLDHCGASWPKVFVPCMY